MDVIAVQKGQFPKTVPPVPGFQTPVVIRGPSPAPDLQAPATARKFTQLSRAPANSSTQVSTVGAECEDQVECDNQEFKLRVTFQHLTRYLMLRSAASPGFWDKTSS